MTAHVVSARRGAPGFRGKMAASASGDHRAAGPVSPRMPRAMLEEKLGKLGITDEEATPLVIDDREEGKPEKWL